MAVDDDGDDDDGDGDDDDGREQEASQARRLLKLGWMRLLGSTGAQREQSSSSCCKAGRAGWSTVKKGTSR
jgi:hypothetical protein